MNQKAGMADSGMASAEMKVARLSRRNRNTMNTASTAPSIMAWIALSYCSMAYFDPSMRNWNFTAGLRFSSSASFFCASRNTETSE